jgi:hypothetical protein
MNLPTILTIVFIGVLLAIGYDCWSGVKILAIMFWSWLINRGKEK